MARVTVDAPDPRTTPKGADLTLINNDDPHIARFAAWIKSSRNNPGGEMNLTLGVPFDQIMNAMPVIRYVQGVMFEVTVRRVPPDQLPESGW